MTETTETAIQTTTNQQQITSFADTLFVDVTEQGYWASFPVETMEDKKILYSARNDNIMLRDFDGDKIEVAGFVLDTVQINDPEVGLKRVPAAHIIAADGKVYQSAATGIVNSVCDIISNFGTPDTWTEPVFVSVKETTTRNGFRYKYLTVL